MTTQDIPVVVYSGTPLEADLLKSLLASEGIRSFLQDEIMGTLAPWYIAAAGAGAVKVVISKADLERATPIVQDFVAQQEDD